MRTRTTLTAVGIATLAATAGITLIPQASAAPAIGHNGRIAYAKTVGGNTDIYTIKADGTGQVRLTTAAGADTLPAYSASGQLIVYVRQPTSATRELWTMKADGSGKRKVTTLNTAQTCAPQFSPDGKRIAFTQTVAGNKRIWTVAVNGTTKRQAITPPADPNARPSLPQDDCAKWSPKPGAGLAYVRTGTDGPNGLGDGYAVLRINTGAADRQLKCGGGYELKVYDFSPDGDSVAVFPHAGESFVYFCDLNTGYSWEPGFYGGAAGLAWSPNGNYVAASKDDGVYLIPVGGGPVGWLRPESQGVGSLSWQPVH